MFGGSVGLLRKFITQQNQAATRIQLICTATKKNVNQLDRDQRSNHKNYVPPKYGGYIPTNNGKYHSNIVHILPTETFSRWRSFSGHRNDKNYESYSFLFLLPLSVLAGSFLMQEHDRKAHCESECTCEECCCSEDTQGSVAAENKQHNLRQKKPCRKLSEKSLRNGSLWQTVEKCKDLCQRIKDETGAPGLTVAVSVNGKQIWAEGLGYADVENRVPCEPDTVMRIASISKPITMAIVGRLWEDGQLDLHKPIKAYVPKWPEKEFKGEKVDITTHQLVTHLGGIRHYKKQNSKSEKKKDTEKDKKAETEDKDKKAVKNESNTEIKNEPKKVMSETALPQFASTTRNSDDDKPEFYLNKNFPSVESALDLFRDDPLTSKPGTEFLYTTFGYTLLSAVLEGASGHKFSVLVKGLLKDLGMTRTYLDENTPLIYKRARFYLKDKRGRLENAPCVDASYKWAGGGLLSTSEDLLKFGNAMLYAYQADNNASGSLPGYLKPKTMREIWKPVDKTKLSWDTDGKYGLGWGVVENKQRHGQCRVQRQYLSHTGGAVGCSSVLVVLPGVEGTDGQGHSKGSAPRGVVVALLTNSASIGLGRVALQIAKHFEEEFAKKEESS